MLFHDVRFRAQAFGVISDMEGSVPHRTSSTLDRSAVESRSLLRARGGVPVPIGVSTGPARRPPSTRRYSSRMGRPSTNTQGSPDSRRRNGLEPRARSPRCGGSSHGWASSAMDGLVARAGGTRRRRRSLPTGSSRGPARQRHGWRSSARAVFTRNVPPFIDPVSSSSKSPSVQPPGRCGRRPPCPPPYPRGRRSDRRSRRYSSHPERPTRMKGWSYVRGCEWRLETLRRTSGVAPMKRNREHWTTRRLLIPHGSRDNARILCSRMRALFLGCWRLGTFGSEPSVRLKCRDFHDWTPTGSCWVDCRQFASRFSPARATSGHPMIQNQGGALHRPDRPDASPPLVEEQPSPTTMDPSGPQR